MRILNNNLFAIKMCNIVLYILVISVFSCKDRKNWYIISEAESTLRKEYTNKDGIVIMPPRIKYGTYTIIIDSTNRKYFYVLPEKGEKALIFDEEEPEKLGITSSEIIVVPEKEEKNFITANIKEWSRSRKPKSIVIASFKDSVEHEFISYLKNQIKNSKEKFSIRIRLALPEERIVISDKVSKVN